MASVSVAANQSQAFRLKLLLEFGWAASHLRTTRSQVLHVHFLESNTLEISRGSAHNQHHYELVKPLV